MSQFISPELIAAVEAANDRLRERRMLRVEQLRADFEECLSRYDERKAREPSGYELDCIGRARDMRETQSYEDYSEVV